MNYNNMKYITDSEKINKSDREMVERFLKRHIVEIYDNGGKSFDRYTLFVIQNKLGVKKVDKVGGVYGSSYNPFDPQGFFQFSHFAADPEKSDYMRYWGDKIELDEVPFSVLLALVKRRDA